MKILHTVPSIDVATGGGLGAAALALHRQMLRAGAQSHLITTHLDHSNAPPDAVTAIRLPFRNPFFYSPAAARIIDDAVRSADVVHAHGLYSHLNWCVGDACARWSKPLVYHPQGTLAPWYLRKRRQAKKLVQLLFENRNFGLVRLWRAVSEQERNDILAVYPRAEVVVVPNGVDLDELPCGDQSARIKAAFSDVDLARKCLLFIGRLAAVKGLDLLLESWARLPELHDQWQLVIAGPDFEGYRSKLVTLASTLHGASSPVLLPSVEGEEKSALLRHAHLLVLPSRAEGLPLTVLESLANRTPVVMTTACNFRPSELKEAAWICEPTTDGLTNALGHALRESENELRARGNSGRQIVEERYAWPSIAERLLTASHALVDDVDLVGAQPEFVGFHHATVGH